MEIIRRKKESKTTQNWKQKKWTDISQILITQHHHNKIKIYSQEHILFIEQYEYHHSSISIMNIEDAKCGWWSPVQSIIIDYSKKVEFNFSKIFDLVFFKKKLISNQFNFSIQILCLIESVSYSNEINQNNL